MNTSLDPLLGVTLGDYRIEEEVGRGGMGVVYRAVHPLIGRKVAVKVLRPEFADDPEQVSRFLKEAQALSAVKHRGVIDIISFGNLPSGSQYMVMEYLEGEALDALLLRESPLSVTRAMALVEEVLDALSAAHRCGVVHRDIKPANVFMLTQSNGTRVVKLVDFGLARRTAVELMDRKGERSSLMAGTPEYISPEQAMGLAATPRSDLYAVGVMLFEMLSGVLPFADAGVVELLDAHVNRPAPLVSSRVTSIPESVDALVASMLEKDPDARPASADLARTAVQRILKEQRTQETHVGATPRTSGVKPALEWASSPARVTGPKPAPARGSGRKPALPRPSPPSTDPDLGNTGDTMRSAPRVGARWSKLVFPALALAGLAVAVALLGQSEREPVIVAVEPQPEPPTLPKTVELPPAPPPPEQAPALDARDEELVPLSGVKATRKPKVAAPPVSVPPFCAASDWQALLVQQVGAAQQRALAQSRFTPEAKESLKAIHVAARDATKSCATLASELSRWRLRFSP